MLSNHSTLLPLLCNAMPEEWNQGRREKKNSAHLKLVRNLWNIAHTLLPLKKQSLCMLYN